jgi:hypothetical protein
MRNRDHYHTLRLHPGASEGEIRASYRRLVRECHPDLHPDDESAGERIKELNEAYEALTKAQEERGPVRIRVRTEPVGYTVRWSQPPSHRMSGPLWEPFFYGYRLSSFEQMLEMMEELDEAFELRWQRLRRLFDLL